MAKELIEEFFSEVRIVDKLKVVRANDIANYSDEKIVIKSIRNKKCK